MRDEIEKLENILKNMYEVFNDLESGVNPKDKLIEIITDLNNIQKNINNVGQAHF